MSDTKLFYAIRGSFSHAISPKTRMKFLGKVFGKKFAKATGISIEDLNRKFSSEFTYLLSEKAAERFVDNLSPDGDKIAYVHDIQEINFDNLVGIYTSYHLYGLFFEDTTGRSTLDIGRISDGRFGEFEIHPYYPNLASILSEDWTYVIENSETLLPHIGRHNSASLDDAQSMLAEIL